MRVYAYCQENGKIKFKGKAWGSMWMCLSEHMHIFHVSQEAMAFFFFNSNIMVVWKIKIFEYENWQQDISWALYSSEITGR